MLAIGRALMSSPKVILLDEPSLGLAPMLVEEIFGIVRRLVSRRSSSVLLVEQNATMALDVADTATSWKPGASCWKAAPKRCARTPTSASSTWAQRGRLAQDPIAT